MNTNPFQFEVNAERNGKVALIKLLVDADRLFNSNGSPNIETGNKNLEHLVLISYGGGQTKVFQGEEIKKEGNFSDVFWGNKVTWMGSLDIASQANGYKIKILQIELPADNCAFDGVNYPGQSGIVHTWVKDDPQDDDCSTWYAIWFELENKNGKTRVFRLDPWMIVR
jgi:hypothetical protein